MFDAKFFEQFVPSCIEMMRDNFEVTGEVGVVVQLADGGSVIVNSVLPLEDPEIGKEGQSLFSQRIHVRGR